MNVRLLSAGLSLVTASVAAGDAAAQNIGGDPLYGTVTLDAGFLPDPHVTAVAAGGDLFLPSAEIVDAVSGSTCLGYVASGQPDVRLHYSGGALLQIGARSGADTTLLVNMPDGSWRCVDDTYALDPALTFEPAPEGQYDIWVGTVLEDTADAELLVTEFSGSAAWQSGADVASAAASLGSLDPSMPPIWGETSLEAGFMPDPFTTSFMAAGSLDLSADGVAPIGFAQRAPSYVVNFTGGNYLRFYASAPEDTVILVRTPTGELLFNDDTDGLNPQAVVSPAPAGAYQVWVGTVAGPGMPTSAELFVSELE